MNILGVRCSNTDFSFAAVSGTRADPVLHCVGTHPIPKGYAIPDALKWLLQELETLGAKHKISHWVIKGAEPMATRDKTFVSRVEFEAMVSLAAANSGSVNVVRKVKRTIAKDLGLPGKVKALKSDLDISLISGLDQMSEKQFEAVVAAWSALK